MAGEVGPLFLRMVLKNRKFNQGISESTRKVKGLSSTVKKMAGAFAAIWAGNQLGRLAGSFIDTARETENYRIRLRALLGSVEEGNRMFDEMREYASRVPFTFQQIMGSATALSGVIKGGVDEIATKWMPLIGDLAAVSGLTIEETTQQVIRMYSAGAASADLFRERGITAMLGFQAGVSYSAEETRTKLIDAWQDTSSKFKGATEEMAGTWDGIVSMIKDKWDLLKQTIMDAGLFDYLKAVLSDIDERFGRWIQENKQWIGEQIPIWIDNIRHGLTEVWEVAKVLGATLKVIADSIRWVVDKIQAWSNFQANLRTMQAAGSPYMAGALAAENPGANYNVEINTQFMTGDRMSAIEAGRVIAEQIAQRDARINGGW